MAPALTPYPSLFRRLALLDYPLPLKIHAYLLLGLGCGLSFAPALVVSNPLFIRTCKLLNVATEVPTNPTVKDGRPLSLALPPSSRRNLTITGLLAIGLGLSYVGTSAFAARPEDNQLLYAAIPLRFAMSAAALYTWVTNAESRSVFSATVIGEDLVGAIWLTWWMRDWPMWSTFKA